MRPRSWCCLGLLLLVSLGAPAPAYADGELGLSRDGVHWAPSLSGPLFDSSMSWVVPGDRETASFFVRNQSGARGDLVVDIRGSRVGSLMETGDLQVTAHGGGGAWHSVSEPGRHRLLSEVRVPSGASRQIAMTVALDPRSTNQSQLKALDLSFRVGLTQHLSSASAADSDGTAGLLPGTGGPYVAWVIGGMAMIGAGFVLARRRNNSTLETHHE